MKILSLDSSSRYISAALAVDGVVRGEFNVSYDRSASEKLALMAKEILDIFGLKVDEIDAFAVSKGPGSFTGLRIAAAMIKAFSFKDDKPIYTVSSLKAMSYRYKGLKYIVPAIDARRDRAFAALYSYENSFELLNEERIYTWMSLLALLMDLVALSLCRAISMENIRKSLGIMLWQAFIERTNPSQKKSLTTL